MGAQAMDRRAMLERLRAARERLAASPSGSGDAGASADRIPVRGDGPAVLSYEQERIWLNDRINGGSRDYNVPHCMAVEGDFDEACFGAALNALAARHEILRTVVHEDGGLPRPVVHPPGPVPVTVTDLRHLGPVTDPPVFAAMVEHAAVKADQSFDLAVDQPIRAAIFRCGARCRLILLTVHHIATDGPSMELMWRELTDRYVDALGRRPFPEPPPLQYADFAAWERGRDADRGPERDAHLQYWGQRLAGLPDDPLPTDLPRSSAGSRSGAEVIFTVPADVTQRLRHVAAQCGATLFMTLLAGFKALLAISGGETDIVVGTPVSGRGQDERDLMLGPCLNVLPLRTDLGGCASFAEAVGRVRETALGAYAHQETPFARIVECLRPGRSLGRNPLFQVLFTHQRRGPVGLAIPDAKVRRVELPAARSKFDLSITFSEEEGGQELIGSILYCSELFEPETVQRLAERFLRVLRSVSEQPNTGLWHLSLHNPDELRTATHRWGRGECRSTGESRVSDLIVSQAARTPDASAVTRGETVLTYGELERRSARLARRLRRAELSAEEPVCICLERSPDLVVALLAVLRAGGSYVPIAPDLPVGRIRQIMEESGARLVLARGESSAVVTGWDPGIELVNVGAESATEGEVDVWLPRGQDTDFSELAYVIFTSGSTGRPKGVMVTQRALANFSADMVERLSLGTFDVVAALTNVSFDIAVLELLVPLTAGARVEIFSRDEAADGALLGQLLTARGVTVVQATPAGWALLISAGWPGGHVRAVCGGEALPGPLAAGIRSRVQDLWNVYGPTETTVWSTAQRVGAATGGRGPSLGRPLLNTSMYVLDALLSPVPVGSAGELYIGGAGLARGYLGQPGLTARQFLPDPFASADSDPGARMYATGDLVRYRHNGHLEFLGRRDHQVKVRGHRIELGEVEARLTEYPSVTQAAVLALGTGADRFLVGYVVRKDQAPDGTSDLMGHLRATLPAYMIPARIVELCQLPLTANGKIDRKALPAPPPFLETGYVPPATRTECVIAQAWTEVLGLERVGVHDDFFALGGHSLRATQLTALLRERLCVDLTARLVFEAPTVRALAAALGTESRAEQVPAYPDEGPAPLSHAQRRLWFLDRLRPGRTDYNVPSAVRLAGPLDTGVLESAIATVLERHDILRSRFVSMADGPVVHIAPRATGWLAFTDVSGAGSGAVAHEAVRVAQEEFGRPFDLAQGPLFRARLLRISDRNHLLTVVMHHAVVDGWSLGIFWREVSEAYRALAAGVAPRLPELPVQYTDFSRWERRQDTTADLAYWRSRLTGSTATEIIPDRARPAEFDHSSASASFEIPHELWRRLGEVRRELGTTSFVILLTAFMATLSRMSGRSNVVVGSPVAGSGRQRPELARLIGPFLNTVVLRADVSGDRSFAACVANVRKAVLEAGAHQDLPFEEVVQALDPVRDLRRHPLFQIMFAVDEDESRTLDIPGITAEPVHLTEQGAKFDLSLVLREHGGGMAGTIVFAASLYEPETIRGITDLYVRLLAEVVARPHRPLSQARPLDAAAATRLVPRAEHEQDAASIHELFERRAAERPDAVAVEQSGTLVTYGELNHRANSLAQRLRAHGLGPGHFVGITLPRSPDLIVALLAVLKSGAAYVPVDTSQPARRMRMLLAQANASAVLAPPADPGTPAAPGGPVLAMSQTGKKPAGQAVAPVLPADLAYVTFTSGSTGRPKAVPATHTAVTRYLLHLVGNCQLGAADAVLQLAAVSFDAAARDILGTLIAGARLVLLPPDAARDPRAILREARLREVTALLSTVPSLLTALAAVSGPDEEVGPLRLILVSGEELTPEVARRTRALRPGIRLVNLYGPTECTMTSTVHQVTEADIVNGRVPIGMSAPGTSAVVLDPWGEPLPTGAVGELCLGGPGVSHGYLGDPALTAQSFAPDPFGPPGSRRYRTGDLVHVNHQGCLVFHGRLDHQIKIRGVRVEPAEVEAALLTSPGIRQAAVVVSDPGGELVAWLVTDEDLDLPRLRGTVADLLPDQMRPSRYSRCAELPRTPHGKIDRRALAHREQPSVTVHERLAPRNRTELRLLGLWEQVLGISPLGVNQDFFEAGGHSLKAVELMEEIRSKLGVDLPLHALFRRPTIEGLAAAVTTTADGAPAATGRLVVPLNNVGGDQLPLFLVHPQSGDVCCYVDLARELGDWRPVHGIEAVGYSTGEPPLTNIEAMAERYIAEIRDIAPRGPYLLAGWSFGGAVALEVAALLEAANEKMAFLGLIDARAFGEDDLEEWYTRYTDLARFGVAHGVNGKDLPTDDDAAVLAILTRHLHDSGRTADYADSHAIRRMIDVFTANGRAADAYHPTAVVKAPLHLFKATERHPTLTNPTVRPASWRHRTTSGVRVIEVPGNHHDLARPPHVKVFASRLRDAVDRSTIANSAGACHDQASPPNQKGARR